MSPVVLVAPAAFKGTLGPRQVAEAVSTGIRRALPEASLLQCPISDGGDGLLDAVLAPASLREKVQVTGPLGTPVSAVLGWVDPETAIFESATASGIALLRPDQLDPLRATTRVREPRSEEHTSELQSPCNLVCRLLLEKKKTRVSQRSPRRSPCSSITPRLGARADLGS